MRLDRSRFLEVVRDSPLVSIDLIVRDEAGRVLLGYRVNAPARNSWFVPGGRVCKDERLDEALRRIAHSELGCDLRRQEADFLGVFEHLYDDNAGDLPGFGTHYVVLAHALRLAPGQSVRTDAQHSDYRWFDTVELLAAEDVHPLTKAYFR